LRPVFAADALAQGLLLNRIVANLRELFGEFLDPLKSGSAYGDFILDRSPLQYCAAN
jgi:hypothetical protein